ncbi:DUF1826 domain-containing protein [Roseivivax sp. THAF30]|uniref:DUF1826 domain-containing protein n=1 Tax=Roseivivax sp. THAF30 TaxID=2587852 RepID=UPI001267EE7A|nr:DUF1826 domain-containing protein [Roseivivax sp. THAF30]QFT62671.1 hypothetical protein FIU91_07005 [Roseivivax sp. THAF30]
MNLEREIVRDAAIGVGVSRQPEGLSAIHTPGCAATIWHREPMSAFQNWIDTVSPELLPRARLILRPEAVRAAVDQVCASQSMPAGGHRDRLVDDIAALADIFAGMMKSTWLRLRLEPVTTDACRRFHVDAMMARLVCTYRGTGTQYGISTDGAEPRKVFTVPTGSPIVLRGSLWTGEPRTGLLHRSPPIVGTGETRLVLVLDPVTEPEDEV